MRVCSLGKFDESGSSDFIAARAHRGRCSSVEYIYKIFHAVLCLIKIVVDQLLLSLRSGQRCLNCKEMTSKLPRASMSLKQFMVHQEVLKLYRNIMRTIKQIPDKQDREYMKNWAKSDFRTNKDIKDEFAIKSLIVHGENSLRELRKNLNLTQ